MKDHERSSTASIRPPVAWPLAPLWPDHPTRASAGERASIAGICDHGVDVAKARHLLAPRAEAGGEWPRQGITGPGAWSTRDGVTWTRHEEGDVAMDPGMIAGYLIDTPAKACRAMLDNMPAGDRRS